MTPKSIIVPLLFAALIIPSSVFAASPLDDSVWLADAGCNFRAIQINADGTAIVADNDGTEVTAEYNTWELSGSTLTIKDHDGFYSVYFGSFAGTVSGKTISGIFTTAGDQGTTETCTLRNRCGGEGSEPCT